MNHLYYSWSYFDKRSRLTHNMIMEHFEVHKEQLEDLIVDLNKFGPTVFDGVPLREPKETVTLDDMALIDEMSGLNDFIDNWLTTQRIPEMHR